VFNDGCYKVSLAARVNLLSAIPIEACCALTPAKTSSKGDVNIFG
jgi:hypothetical protein